MRSVFLSILLVLLFITSCSQQAAEEGEKNSDDSTYGVFCPRFDNCKIYPNGYEFGVVGKVSRGVAIRTNNSANITGVYILFPETCEYSLYEARSGLEWEIIALKAPIQLGTNSPKVMSLIFCSQGHDVGQNINHFYCQIDLGRKTPRINHQGNVLDRGRYIQMYPVEYDQNGKLVSQYCDPESTGEEAFTTPNYEIEILNATWAETGEIISLDNPLKYRK